VHDVSGVQPVATLSVPCLVALDPGCVAHADTCSNNLALLQAAVATEGVDAASGGIFASRAAQFEAMVEAVGEDRGMVRLVQDGATLVQEMTTENKGLRNHLKV
jgi:hypothetical protein